MKKRIEFIDLAKGFCIILVVLGHVDIDNSFAHMCSSFRMPLYYALSGLFFSTYSNFIEFTIKKINNLIIPFLFFNIFLWLIYIIFYNARILPISLFKFFYVDKIQYNPPIWFLLSLFEINILFYILYLLTKGKEFLIILFSVFIGTLGFYFGRNGINISVFVDTSLTTFPFFICGYLLKNHTQILNPNKFDKYIPWMLIPLILIIYFLAGTTDLRINKINNNIFLFYLVGISGFLFILLLSKKINHLPVITYMGKYSLIILGIHWLYLMIINREIKPHFPNSFAFDMIYFILVLLFSYLSIPILKKLFPWFTAQKETIPSKWARKK